MEFPFQIYIYSFPSVYVLHLTEFSKKISLSYPPTVYSRTAGPELKAGHSGRAATLELDPELQ